MARTRAKIQRHEISYLDGVNTLVMDNIAKRSELSHAENARSTVIGGIEKRAGTNTLGSALTATKNKGLFYFENNLGTSTGFYRISTVGAVTSIYYLKTDDAWTVLSGGGAGLTEAQFSSTIAEGCCFLVNNNDANRYIKADGTTVVDSTSSTGHLYNSPIANKINYYRDRLYLGDYTNTTRVSNGIMMSSVPLGIVGLVDGDHTAPGASDWITVTDTKYIFSTDALEIYRGGDKIAYVTIKDKKENKIQINAITFFSGTDLESADEVWVNNSYTGTKVFRWANNPASGVDVKQYDTFKITGGQNDRTKMMTNVGDVMIISNNFNVAVWNNSNLVNYDLGIGCVSDNGYVKTKSGLWFGGYGGIYFTIGGPPELKSAKVQKYYDGATKSGLEAGAMGTKGDSIFHAIGAVTLYHPDGSVKKTLSNVVIEYNTRQNNFYVHTGIKATQFATYVESSDPDKLEYTSTDTNYPVREFLVNNLDDYGGDNDEIPFVIETSNITLMRDVEKLANPTEIIIIAERGNSIKTFVSLDSGAFYELHGDARKGCTIVKVNNKDKDRNEPPTCRTIKLSLRDFSPSICKISKIIIVYAETEESEDHRPNQNG